MKKHISVSLVLALSASLWADDTSTQQEAMQEAKLGKSTVTAQVMRSELDELNRSVYKIDKEQIAEKGYRSSEEIFRYTPFVGLANVGLGSNLDLRGQGNRANTSVQVLINGNYSNMLDSSHGVTPLNTLSPNSIESIEVLPGGGAVMYGNGTRGGLLISLHKKDMRLHILVRDLAILIPLLAWGIIITPMCALAGRLARGLISPRARHISIEADLD